MLFSPFQRAFPRQAVISHVRFTAWFSDRKMPVARFNRLKSDGLSQSFKDVETPFCHVRTVCYHAVNERG